MRYVFAVLALFVFASSTSAQEAYTVNANATQVSVLDFERLEHNARLCASRGLASNCTQAQFTTAGGTGTIYAATLAGRQSFLIQQWIADNFRLAKMRQAERNRTAYCIWWNDPARTLAEKNAECAKVGSSAGCDLCE